MEEEATTQWVSLKERKGSLGNVILKLRVGKWNQEKRFAVRLQEHICIWTLFTLAEGLSQRKTGNSLKHGIEVPPWMSGNVKEQKGLKKYRATGMR